jgi:hypothetical protein
MDQTATGENPYNKQRDAMCDDVIHHSTEPVLRRPSAIIVLFMRHQKYTDAKAQVSDLMLLEHKRTYPRIWGDCEVVRSSTTDTRSPKAH